MNNLESFEAPKEGELTLCEVDGRVHSMGFEYSNITAFTNTTQKHPKVHITRDMLHPYKTGDEASKTLFLPVDVPFLKQIMHVYYEHGFLEAMQTVANHRQIGISQAAQLILSCVEKVNNIKAFYNPILKNNSTLIIEEYSSTKKWFKSPIRCIAWHSDCTKIAVGTSDDTVRIYTNDSHTIPVLKCKQQKNITCIAWRPLSNSDIAVGYEQGIIIWNVDPNSIVTKPSTSSAVILQRLEHQPILSISWSPRGDFLASVAGCDSKILLWDVEMDRTSTLKRPGSLGNTLLKWSPSGNKLFAATTSVLFRVWECNRWEAERWVVLSGRVQAACWSPCGNNLLFSTNEEPVIYALSFLTSETLFAADTINSPNQAIALFDVTKVDIDGAIVGGIIKSMDWDAKGNHLAVLFHDTNYVAVFGVINTPNLHLSPSCLIAGNSEEVPCVISFQKNFEHGACLSIAWSSGRLQQFPIVYTDYSYAASPKLQRSNYESFNAMSPNNILSSPTNASFYST